MKEQVAIQRLLRKRLTELQARNPAYSVRAFAQRLSLQPAATNEILKGERRVSRKMAEKIADKLHLDPTERATLLGAFPDRCAPKAVTVDQDKVGEDYLKLTADQFHIISDWVHFAILNLIETADFKNNPAWIAERLAITQARAVSSLERLFRLKLIEAGKNGALKRTHARVRTSDDVLSVSIQKSHIQDMELARESLLKDPVELRDFTSLMIPVAPHLLPKAKEAIRKAQDEIAVLLASEPATEVYRMTSYLFPVSKRKINTSKKVGEKK